MKKLSLKIGQNYKSEIIKTTPEPNNHMFVLGRSGSGKTYKLICSALEAISQGKSVISIDLANSFDISQLPEEMTEFLGEKLHIIDVGKGDEVPINVFRVKAASIEEKDRRISNTGQGVADCLSMGLELSFSQKQLIYNAYKFVAEEQENVFLSDLCDGIELMGDSKGNKVTARKVYDKLRPLKENVRFSSEGDEFWNRFIDSDEMIILQLSSLPNSLKKLVVELILNDLLKYISDYNTEGKEFVVIIDEIQLIDASNESAFSKAITLGRKWGLCLWYSTQFIGHSNNAATIKRLEQAANKLFFSPTESDIKIIIDRLLGEKDSRWQKYFPYLKTGMCIVHNTENAFENKINKIVKCFSIEETISKIKSNDNI